MRMRNKQNNPADANASSYIWNSIGGLLNAFQSVVMLMVITRACGLTAAGIYSIAYATGNLFLYLGNYGVRNYQVSDLHEQYRFRDYLSHRMVTLLLMLLLSMLFCMYHLLNGSYSGEKTAIVFAMCVLKCEDCIEEVFEGRLHQKGHLDLAGKMMTARMLVSIGGMILVLVLTRNLLWSTWAAIVLAFVSFGWMAWRFRREIDPDGMRNSRYKVKRQGRRRAVSGLMRACFPVCAANFLSFYLINAPKYAIDAAMNETAQARYNFIAMPVFVIQLLTMFIYQPVMVQMTRFWETGSEYSADALLPNGSTGHKDARMHRPVKKACTWAGRKGFLRLFFQVVGWLLGISAVVLAGAWFLGVPVLSALYATDLSPLKKDLMVLLAGSIFLAMNGFYCAVLTIMRLQNRIPVVYLIGAALSLAFTTRMVQQNGIDGAVTSFSCIMILVCLLLTEQFVSGLRHRMDTYRKEEYW